MKRIILAFALLATVGCAPLSQYGGRSTSLLTTPGIQALHTVEVVKVMDVFRDVAIDGEAVKVIATSDARIIVEAHKAALQILRELPNGWKAVVVKGLEEAKGKLSPNAKINVGPYIDSAISVIKAVL